MVNFLCAVLGFVLPACDQLEPQQPEETFKQPVIEIIQPVVESKPKTQCTPNRRVPQAACDYEPLIEKYTVSYFKTDKYTALHASQIKKESNFNCEAVSWVGAEGCAQFMPTTQTWAHETICSVYGRPKPNDMQWAVPCMIAYNYYHSTRVKGHTEFDLWTKILVAYNAGLGWVWRDEKLTKQRGGDPMNALQVVKNSRRSEANRRQSEDYADKIINEFIPLMIEAGITGELIDKKQKINL